MPIASGAAGRVDVGVDNVTGTTWTPDGLRRKAKPANSYLQRYQELKRRKDNKSNLLQGTQDKTDPSDENENENENDGAKEENPQNNGSSEDHASGKLPAEKRSKTKSQLCVLL